MCFPQAVMSAASGVAEDPERAEDVVKRGEEEGKGKPLSLKWPETLPKQAVFLFLLPITFPVWLTLPDVRNLVRNSVCICRTGGGILHKPTPLIFFCLLEIWEISCGHFPGIYCMDSHLLLFHAAVGASGQLLCFHMLLQNKENFPLCLNLFEHKSDSDRQV